MDASSEMALVEGSFLMNGIARTARGGRELTVRRSRRTGVPDKTTLRSSETQFRAFFEQAAVGMALLGLDGRWQMVNDKLAELLGFTPGELSTRSLQEMIHPDDRQAHIESSRRLLQDEVLSNTKEKRLVRRDGSYRWYRITRSLARNSFGIPDYYITVVEDIADQRRAEEALRESEERYRFLFNNNPQSMWVYDPHSFELLAVNDVATQRYGYSRPEFLGMTINDIRPLDGPGAPHSGTSSSDFDLLGAWRLRRKDGTLINVEISSQLMRFGDRTARLVIAHDITERRQAEEEKRRLQDKIETSALEWQLTFDAIEAPMLIFDLNGRLTRMNRAARTLRGDGDGSYVDVTIGDLGSGPLWRKAAEALNGVRDSRVASAFEVRDGGRTWQLTASFAKFPGAQDERLVLVISETTRIVELQASLSRTETMSMLGTLVSGVAHEVRNPLFGISATLDAYEACAGSHEIDQRYLVVLRKEVNRLNDLMKDLLDYGQPPKHELQVGKASEAIAKAIASSTPLARRRQVEIVNELADELPLIRLNPERLPQVFLNLLENAIQHSPAGSIVTIEANRMSDQSGEWIVCSVRDSGRGFDPADLPRIFEPFFTRRTGGTGLGLSIVQKIVEEHGGVLTASNSATGGAEMTVKLPIDTGNRE